MVLNLPNTIKEVAKLAGVSVSTVSRVINSSGYVKSETRDRVVEAMKTLRFNPSSVARGLVIGKTSTVGLLLPDVSNPFFAEVARGIEEAAMAHGFTVIFCNSDWKLEYERTYLDVLKSKSVEGVIIIGNRNSEAEIIDIMSPVPCIFVDRRMESDHENYIWIDHCAGAAIATKKLIDTGCQRIAHICGPNQSTSAAARLAGYQAAMKDADLEPVIYQGNFRFTGGYQAAKEMLASECPPDGVFVGNDMMAIGVLQAAGELGVKIPADLSVIGYDDIEMAGCTFPPLTTIRQPAHEMGRAAFSLLKNRSVHTKVEFKPTLVERSSTK